VIYIGIDPGGVYSGFAASDGKRFIRWFETKDPTLLVEGISDLESVAIPTVIVEDFIGQGRLNYYRKRTLMILGYVQFTCKANGWLLETPNPQKRLAYVSLVPPEIQGKDEIAAAAHVIAYLDTKG
jgi:hypothetical protein